LGTALSSGVVGFSGVSLAVNLIFAASLQLLWGLLATLQLIVHMPLQNVATPSNFFLFSQMIIGTANFQIIPLGKLVDSIMQFTE